MLKTHFSFDKKNAVFWSVQNHFPIEKAYSPLYFEKNSPTQKLLHHQKYKDPNLFCEYFLSKISREILQEIKKEITAILPIPLSPSKEKNRGFNQIVPFAKTLSKALDIPIIENYLLRSTESSSQVFRNKEERKIQIQGNFHLGKEKMSDHHFLLVDDLCTTGSTLGECAKTLCQNSNNKVSVFSLAYVG
ncbi:MAG: hypothetical protein C4K58_00065 [Flavobacteriaceae bacterium]|nr:MAG: hypothetical protein C4K58_00065 [Flavobacteriaceae bacterium]